MTTRLRRSELSTPGSSEKMIKKAAASDADLVFLDLEDSVAPSEKPRARTLVASALRELDWGKKTRAVRVNAAETPFAHDDVITIVEEAREHLDVIIVPKVKAPRDVWFFDTLLDQLERKLDLNKRIALELLIEEVEAVAAVDEIARCSPRLEALILGPGDLSASQGIRQGPIGPNNDVYPGDIWHYARTRIVVAARSTGLDAIDGPFADYSDPTGYTQQAAWAASLGFVGKWAIHPSQIPLANEVYSPSEEEIALARGIVEAMQRAEQQGHGAAAHKGTMIDAAIVRSAQILLDRAAMMEK